MLRTGIGCMGVLVTRWAASSMLAGLAPHKVTRSTGLEKIRIQFTLFSAFYSPLISAMSGGFLRAEGLEPEWTVSPPGVSALAALQDGAAHVVQSALSQGFATLNEGRTPAAVH